MESNLQELYYHMACVEERVGKESELVLQFQQAQQGHLNKMIDERMAGVMKSIEDQGSNLLQLHMDVAYVNEKVTGLKNKIALMTEQPFTLTPKNAASAPTLPSSVHTESDQHPTIIGRGMTSTANPHDTNSVNR